LNPEAKMLSRIWAITKKELRQIRRDVRTLIVLLFFPIFMLILFGYALNFDVSKITIAVYDQDKSELSRDYINILQSSEYFKIVHYIDNQQAVNNMLDEKQAQCVIVIPDNLSEKFYSKETAKIQYLIDGVDGSTATVIMSYVSAATRDLSQKYANEILARNGLKMFQPLNVEPVFWFNPELKTTQFLMPGLIASILITLAVILTAVAIVREKELGTIEQINVSPVTSIELLLGKIFPYTLISLLIAALIIISGNVIFDVHIKGSIVLLFISTMFYLFAALNIGIFVSTIADSQQVAFQMGILISQLPSNMLSGFIFPIESMPKFIQLLSNITPAKYFIICLRAILIRGAGIEAFWEQLVYMFIFALFFLGLSTLRTIRQRV
jgi:ABC-2 type transport system permease protein